MITAINYEAEVKKVYPDAECHCLRINNWNPYYIIGKTSKPFTECEEDEDFLTDVYKSPEQAWKSAYNKLNSEKQ